MRDARFISPSDVRLYYFGSKDVLSQPNERESRERKLKRAMVLTNSAHQAISIYIQLPTGERLETQSDLVTYTDTDNYVIVKGGYTIPVSAIVDIDI